MITASSRESAAVEAESDAGSRSAPLVTTHTNRIYAPNQPVAPFVPTGQAPQSYPGGGGIGGYGAGGGYGQQMHPYQQQQAAPIVKHHRVWVVSSKIYVQLLSAAGAGKAPEWGCFTDQEQPSAKNYHLVRNSESRQIDLDEEADGLDPKIASKLRPGEHFNNRDLRKKYQSAETPLILSPEDCKRLSSGR